MRETVYKLDSKGKMRYITIYPEGSTIVQISGLIDGNPVTNVSQCESKNVGKINSTTPEEQAVLEARAKIKKKLEEGYFRTPEEARTEEYVSPMLAKDFKKESKKVTYPCYVQPKLDGMRCLKKLKTMTSRDNKPITTLPHIANEILEIADYFDGELYAHGKTFQENMTLIKKYRPGESEQVKFHVYDMVLPNLAFSHRYNLLRAIINTHQPDNIELVPTYRIENKEELDKYHAQFIEEGYEGTMVRWGNEGYKVNGRSSNLLKYKDFLDIACEIVDVEPSEKRPTQGRFTCKLPNGKIFGTGMRFNVQQKEEILTNKSEYIGKTAEIRFFEYTDDGLPRFPVCVGVRLDK